MEIALLRIQLQTIVHVRIRPAEFKNSLDLVADLERRDGKREKTTRPARKMGRATSFPKTPMRSAMLAATSLENAGFQMHCRISAGEAVIAAGPKPASVSSHSRQSC